MCTVTALTYEPALVAQRKFPLLLSLAINPPPPVNVVAPNVAGPLKPPTTYTLFTASSARPTPRSGPVPPAFVAQRNVPLGLSLAITASSPPALCNVVEPQFALP